MSSNTAIKIINLITKGVPYPRLITFSPSEDDVVRFSWRGTNFRVSGELSDLFVEVISDGGLLGSNISMLMDVLLRRVAIEQAEAE